MTEITILLNALDAGDRQATGKLLPLVYDELRRVATQKLAEEKPGLTLQPTALVHEAYLRLVGNEGEERSWQSRGHFFAAAAEAMRRILVDNARRKRRQKHGGDHVRQELDPDVLPVAEPREHVFALNEALDCLAAKDLRKAEIVKLRYFAGLSMAEVAQVLNISLSTVEKDWTYARLWLYREMSD